MLAKIVNKILSLSFNAAFCARKENGHLRGLTFRAVILDDWNGLRHPIGIVHEVKMANGDVREVFTFCNHSERQPAMALFVEKRTGNLASGLVLNHTDLDRVPNFLKTLPHEYKEAHFAGRNNTPFALAV